MRRGPAASVLVAALSLSLLAPASAFAHAQLEGTVPERGAVVKHEPPTVIFRFDEPVEGNFGAVRVYDAEGSRVDEGDAFHPNGEGPRIGVHLKPGLPDGSYTATYRVISADGHIVSSGFVFSIGKPGKAPSETVAELTAGSGSGPVTETVFGLARGLQYAATALAVGGLVFLLLAWLPSLAGLGGVGDAWSRSARAFGSRLRATLIVAAIVGAISAAAGIVMEGAEAAGVSGFSALEWTIVHETLETKFGTIWGIRPVSRIALISVGAILLTGLIQAYVYVRHLDALVETGYGRAVLIKFLLLLVLIALGAYNRRRTVPRLRRIATGGGSPGRVGVLLRRALRTEVALLVVVLGVTAALASYAPPVTAQSGPFSTESQFGPIELEMTVEPARVGANEIHIYLFDAKSGAPFAKIKQFEATASLPDKGISLPLEPQFSGPGHYTIPSAFLNASGEWRIELTIRVSAFDEFTKTVEVPIR